MIASIWNSNVFFKGHENNVIFFVLTFILKQQTSAVINSRTTSKSYAKLAIFIIHAKLVIFRFFRRMT